MAPLLLLSLLSNAAIINLAAIIKNRARPFRAELFNTVASSYMWRLNFKHKIK